MITKQLLLNLSFLLVLLFFFQMWYERQKKTPTMKNYKIYFVLSLLICLFLSNPITSQYFFDLRQIPLTLAGLYAGFSGGFLLFGITILVRSFWGIDAGFWTTFITFAFHAFLTGLLHTWYMRRTVNQKVLVAAVLCTFPSLVYIVVQSLNGISIGMEFIFGFLIIPVTGTLILTYTLESIRNNYLLREEIEKAEKMKLVGHLSASISHEIRNPLTAVRGFLQLIKDPAFPEQKRIEFTEIAIVELDRTESIISDYLTFAKPATATAMKINLLELINNILLVITPLANMNSVIITKNIEADTYMQGDKNKLFQSLLNILKNGIEAMPKGGTLSINSYVKNNHIIIEMEDTGFGMTKEQVNRLGEPYFSTKGVKGTGLGMMVSYSIIRSMNGKITVESEVGKGTKFTLSFPNVIDEEQTKIS
jgi:two-component system, sporulation sensor kinase B